MRRKLIFVVLEYFDSGSQIQGSDENVMELCCEVIVTF